MSFDGQTRTNSMVSALPLPRPQSSPPPPPVLVQRSFSVGGTGTGREGGRGGAAVFSHLNPPQEGQALLDGWEGGREGGREGGQQEQLYNKALEQLHARQLAKEVGNMVDEEGDKMRSLQRYWSKISRKQGGFQGLHVILDSLKENEAVDESYVCSGL